MKVIGVVKNYNGSYGEIKSELGIIEFDKKDISSNQELKIEDVVEFRVEEKTGNIKLARNISIIKNNNKNWISYY